MFRQLHFLLAFSILAFLLSLGGVTPLEANEITEKDIIEAWQARERSYEKARFTWLEEQVILAKSQLPPPAPSPGVPSESYPAVDTVSNNKVALCIALDSWTIEREGLHPSGDVGRLVRRVRRTSFDSQFGQIFWGPDLDSPIDDIGTFPFAIRNRIAPGETLLDAADNPPMLFVRPSWHRINRPKDGFSISEARIDRAMTGQKGDVYLRSEAGSLSYLLRVSGSTFYPLRLECWLRTSDSGTVPFITCDFTYDDPAAKTAFPSSWSATCFQPGSQNRPMQSTRGHSIVALPPKACDCHSLPIDTLVYEGSKQFLVTARGEEPVERGEGNSPYSEKKARIRSRMNSGTSIWLVIAAVVVGVSIVIFWRRRVS